ncbi:MAG: hypothetical protein AAF627_13260 [Myxococcota bacterium]
MSSEPSREERDDSPPIMGSWNGLYAVVLGFLFLQVLMYWALSAWAS